MIPNSQDDATARKTLGETQALGMVAGRNFSFYDLRILGMQAGKPRPGLWKNTPTDPLPSPVASPPGCPFFLRTVPGKAETLLEERCHGAARGNSRTCPVRN